MKRSESAFPVRAAGLLAPGGLDVDRILAGRSAIGDLPPEFPVPAGARVLAPLALPDDFPFPLAPRALLLALAAIERLPERPSGPKTGLVLAMSSLYADPSYLDPLLDGRDDPAAAAPLGAFNGTFPLEYIARRFGVPGPRVRIDTACASGSDAVIVAHEWLAEGRVDDVLVVAASSMLNPVGVALFHNLRALSSERGPAASRPFDRRRRGFVMGEGAAAIWMSRRDTADRLGFVLGHGRSMNAEKFTDMPADLGAMEIACRRALGDVVPAYISAHGTGTPVNDPCETKLYKRLFGERARSIPISSIKSMTGHCLGASSLIEVIVTLAALCRGQAPPTLHLEEPDPECDLDYVPLVPRAITGDCALSTAFAFGGHNSALLLAREAAS